LARRRRASHEREEIGSAPQIGRDPLGCLHTMYHHTQPATVTRIAAVAALVMAVYTVAAVGSRPTVWLLVAAAVLGLFTFGSMTVQVDQDGFRFWFGPGWIGRSFSLAEIKSWSPVINPWWYGWGIHLTPQGWLYNVGGAGAIQLELRDGRRLRVGTDEPERLCDAVKAMKGAA
jgi:hypothetical protein